MIIHLVFVVDALTTQASMLTTDKSKEPLKINNAPVGYFWTLVKPLIQQITAFSQLNWNVMEFEVYQMSGSAHI